MPIKHSNRFHNVAVESPSLEIFIHFEQPDLIWTNLGSDFQSLFQLKLFYITTAQEMYFIFVEAQFKKL